MEAAHTLPVISPAPPPPIAWQEIIAIEPRVQDIIDDAAQLEGGDWPDYDWYSLQLSRFVGWSSADERLRDPLCYCEASRRLVEALKI